MRYNRRRRKTKNALTWFVQDIGPEVHVVPDQTGHILDQICFCTPALIRDPGARPVIVHNEFRGDEREFA